MAEADAGCHSAAMSGGPGEQPRWYEQGPAGPPGRYGETRIGAPGPQQPGPQSPGPHPYGAPQGPPPWPPSPGPAYTQPGPPPYGPGWGAAPSPYGPPPAARSGRVPVVVAAVLLLVAAALAIGGTFAPFATYSFSDLNTSISTGWAVTYEPPDPDYETVGDLSGIPITAGAALSLLAAILLLASRRPAPAVRLIGVTGAAVLVGAVATVLLGLLTTAANVAQTESDSESAGLSSMTTYLIGPGAWIELAAAAVALGAILVLMMRPTPQ